MKLKKNKIFIFCFLIISLFLKIDFRLQDDINCCSDDSDYFMHAETIVEDLDFNYINQLGVYKNSRYVKYSYSPLAFPGSAIYSSPFMFFGINLDKMLNFFEINLQITNFKIFYYSISSVFYLLFSIILLKKTLEILKIEHNPIHLLVFFLGSGISYYAFERYSMSHTYEVFSISLIIYLSTSYFAFESKTNLRMFLLAFFMVLGFYVKWVYYYIFLIPYLIKELFFPKNNKRLYSKIPFLIFFIFMVFIALKVSDLIYGQFTLNAANIYDRNLAIEAVSNSIYDLNYILKLLKNFVIILFTQEFGVFWFQPILFVATIIVIYHLIKNLINLRIKILDIALVLTFSQVYIIQAMWESTGSSYGFRYLLNLTPISVIIFYSFQKKYNLKIISNILIILSVFSIFSTLFFETSIETQLSLDRTLNSFNRMSLYTQKEYLSGYIKSIFLIDSYFKIFITSYIGIFFLKPLLSLVSLEEVLDIFGKLNLPINNPKFLDLINKLDQISYIYFIIVFLTIIFLTVFLVKNLKLHYWDIKK